MSSESSPKDRRGKTTLHGVKATPKAMRPVQPEHVYDSYDEERHERREERRARRHRSGPDLTTYGIFAFFAVLALGVVFFLVQGGSTMEFNRVEETQEEIRAKNEVARKINEERAREAANRSQPPATETPRDLAIPPRQPATVAPVGPAVRVAPVTATEPAGEAPRGGISAGMVAPEQQKKLSTEPRTTVPEEMKK